MNFKKIITVLLVMALTATAAVGGTLAYFTDRDAEANVFTVGDVSIDLKEDYQQGSTLIPGVDINKDAYITNTGKNDAWVWATVAIPAALDNEDASKNVVHFNYDAANYGADGWTWSDKVITTKIEGVEYKVYTTLYNKAVPPDGETTMFLDKVYMDKHIDIDPDGNWAWVDNGNVTEINWNSNTNGNPVIYVSAYAAQIEGFDTVQEAYDAYQTQWKENGTEYGALPTLVATADEVLAALEAGTTPVLTQDITLDAGNKITIADGVSATIDLNGHELAGSSVETGANRSLITVKGDLTITGGELTMTHTGNDMGWSNLVAAVSVEGGTLTLEDVIVNASGSAMTFGVDVNTTLGTTVLNIDGETSITSSYTGIRIFNNHSTQTGTVNLNSGTVKGDKRDIWVHNPSAKAVDANGIVNFADDYTYAMTVQETSYNGRIYQIN